MYESFYGLTAKPFQLQPDPSFYFASKGHKRAMAYLEYGLSQGEGFIIITGEVGAGKTTLMRTLFKKLESEEIISAQIVNTYLNADEVLRMVAAAFGLNIENITKASLLIELEKFLRQCDQQGKRALLVVDEAQNLSADTLEQLRMLSNYQTDDKPLLQTFLLGQPEFRRILLGNTMQQLRQRVIATYHLGPMDALETRAYIEHRLKMVGWQDDPVIQDGAFSLIHEQSGGIPRKINTLCNRMLIMGYLDELHSFGVHEVNEVIQDIEQEFDSSGLELNEPNLPLDSTSNAPEVEQMGDRLNKMEKSVISVLDLLKQVLSLSSVKNKTQNHK